ncbi:hypothetical protein [Catellatospora paridis]|nr:hypothetical protein [Catellatospora paridis]
MDAFVVLALVGALAQSLVAAAGGRGLTLSTLWTSVGSPVRRVQD